MKHPMMFPLIPVLDQTIPATRHNFALLERMPLTTNTHALMRLERAIHFTAFPVPEPHSTVRVSTHQEPNDKREKLE